METKDHLPGYFAPMQESTDYVYRRAHANHFAGIDKYFSPYLVVQKEGGLKRSQIRDTLPENCRRTPLVPQIMAGNCADFLFLANYLADSGYQEINWNLGCPYPMVTKRGLGAGLLQKPEQIREILEGVFSRISGQLSVKLRSGLESKEEIRQVLAVLNDFPLSEIILHPRIASQLYHGSPDYELFEEVTHLTPHSLIYNGEITTLGDFEAVLERFPRISGWMIGRGMLKNPFLAAEIKGLPLPDPAERIAILESFHGEVFNAWSVMLSGQSHLIMRMTKFWEYFCFSFPNPHKAFKRVKKSVNQTKYELAVRENFLQLRSEGA